MPTYTYRCKKCARVQDIFHGMSQVRRVKCAVCGGPCQRLIGTGSGIIFKGSGFYETDYKQKGSKTGTNGETQSTTPSESKPTAEPAGTKEKSASSTAPKGD